MRFKTHQFVPLIAALLTFVSCWPAQAADPVLSMSLGANAASFNQSSHLPSDFELGGTGSASLSPHISGVGSLFFGVSRTYLRGSAGMRVTATDVNDPNFSIGLGLQYQVCSEADLRPQEWAPDASIGWRPCPEMMPRVSVGAQGSYGLDSGTAMLLLAVRYSLPSF